MWEFRRVGEDGDTSWLRTLILVPAAAFLSLVSVVFSRFSIDARVSDAVGPALLALVALLAAVLFAVALAWRHRFPFGLVAASTVASLLLPIGNTVPLAALASLIGRRAGPRVVLAAVGVSLSAAWVATADWMAQPREASVMKQLFSSSHDASTQVQLGPELLAMAILVPLGTSLGLGWFSRSRRETAAQRYHSDRLGDELARQRERELIAREVHDALGHRLSLLNLHAGALEVNASQDPRLADSARLVRQSAGGALDDLRSLLQVLREPGAVEAPDMSLAQLGDVVQEAYGAGQPLRCSIAVTDADRADPALARAVYRIVQELLTNARKHAPGCEAWLLVQGGREAGITIDCSNVYLGNWGSAPPGSSRGLSGVAERAELLGGTVRFGVSPDGRTFRVTAVIPWRGN